MLNDQLTHITALCPLEANKFRIYGATKHKVNAYNEYLTQSDNSASI